MEKPSNIHEQALTPGTRSRAGFTLLETAAVIMLAGILMGGGMIAWASHVQKFRVDQSKDRMEQVLNAFSSYAQRYNRLPCPALPNGDGLERDGGDCLTSDAGATAANNYEKMQGVVPWRALAIPESLTKDAWGHYFTYKPAPHLTVNTSSDEMQDTADANPSVIHDACRNQLWYEQDASGKVHAARGKALFCCNATPTSGYLGGRTLATNWRDAAIYAAGILPAAGPTSNTDPAALNEPVVTTNAWTEDETTDGGSRYGGFKPDNMHRGASSDSSLMRANGFGVTLISHGGDGLFSFLRGKQPNERSLSDIGIAGLSGTRVGEQAIGVDEQYNVWPPQIAAGTVYNPKTSAGRADVMGRARDTDGRSASDDLVVYARTDQLYSRVGDGTCARPVVLAAVALAPSSSGSTPTSSTSSSSGAPTSSSSGAPTSSSSSGGGSSSGPNEPTDPTDPTDPPDEEPSGSSSSSGGDPQPVPQNWLNCPRIGASEEVLFQSDTLIDCQDFVYTDYTRYGITLRDVPNCTGAPGNPSDVNASRQCVLRIEETGARCKVIGRTCPDCTN